MTADSSARQTLLDPDRRHAFTAKHLWGLLSACVALTASTAYAAAFGPLQVHSTLGNPLHISVPLYGVEDFDFSQPCVKVNAASVDGQTPIRTSLQFVQGKEQLLVQIRSSKAVSEPALAVSVSVACGSDLRRDYQFLLDPPELASLTSEAPTGMLPLRKERVAGVSGEPVQQQPLNAPRKRVAGAQTAAISGINEEVRRKRSDAGNAPNRSTRGASKPAQGVLKLSLDMDIGDQRQRNLPPNGSTYPAETRRPDVVEPAQQSMPAQSSSEDALRAVEKTLAAIEAESRKLRAEVQHLQQEMRNERLSAAEKQAQLESWLQMLGAALVASLAALGWALSRHRLSRGGVKQGGRFTPISTLAAAGRRSLGVLRERYGAKRSWSPLGGESDTAALANSEDSQSAKHFKSAAATALQGQAEPVSNIAAENALDVHLGDDLRVLPHRLYKPRHPDEISDLVELAEAWLALKQPEAVIDVLESFEQEDPPASPVPWLCLLSAYIAVGDSESYTALSIRTRQHFNVDMPTWEDQVRDAQPRLTLANFPHVRERILELWGTSEIVPYLESLLPDARGGVRDGFPLGVYQDIVHLIRIAKDPAPHTEAGMLPPMAAQLLMPTGSAGQKTASESEKKTKVEVVRASG